MRAFIINLDSAPERWSFVEKAFAQTKLEVCRVSAVNGHALELPIPEYAEKRYRWTHGKPTSQGEIGCYLSHLKAMREFLLTNDEHALVAEDDITLADDFEKVLEDALRHGKRWSLLRLTGLSRGHPMTIARLLGNYRLCVGFGRLKGTGAYLINRQAAQALVKGLLPMRLPIDHAIDREWFFGLRAAYVYPFPASQNDSGFRSSIQIGKARKFSSLRRVFTTYPYQAFNEVSRWFFRGCQVLRA